MTLNLIACREKLYTQISNTLKKDSCSKKKRIMGTLYYTLDYLTPWLMEPGGSMPHSQGLSNNPYPETNQPNPRIDAYFVKIYSNILCPSIYA